VNKIYHFFILSFVIANVTTQSIAAGTSPDGKIKVEVFVRNDSLFYQASRNNLLLIAPSNLGVKLVGYDFSANISIKEVKINEVNDSYTLPSGKKSVYANHYNEMIVTLRNVTAEMDVIFRIYNDGLAFRYHIAKNGGSIEFRNEFSEVNTAHYEYSWMQEYFMKDKDYSWYYKRRQWDFSDLTEKFLCVPALVQTENAFLLITEAANSGNYPASLLIPDETGGHFHFQLAGNVSGNFPFETPWRVILAGDIREIVESTLIENLNPPTELTGLAWIIPGRTSWDWGGEDARNSVGFEIAKRYIDLAQRMGWEYFTLDDGWDSNQADYTLSELIDYANDKSVGVILWTHHNRFQNNKNDMRNKLQVWKNLGIKGVKVDFWQNDSQEMMQKYDNLLEVTGELELLVDLHGCTKPSGTRRKYPHLLTSEAVLGGEFYIQNDPYMVHAAHNINLTMTRNVIGPMDYTPCDFGKKNGLIQKTTSWSHQLAQTIAYESGIQFLIDAPENYQYHVAESFLKYFPVAWDNLKCIEAQPDDFVTIARQKGDDWYVASLTNQARTLTLNLDFLDGDKTYHAYIYQDGDCRSEIKFDYIPHLTAQDEINIALLPAGGATVHLSVSDAFPKPEVRKYEAENAGTFGLSKPVDTDGLCSGGKYVASPGKKRTVIFEDVSVEETGDYALTIYYMSNGEKSAYIKINGETEPLYYPFINSGGETGNYLAYRTIIVPLNKGNNTIELGNPDDFIPNLDRITIKSLTDSKAAPTSLPAFPLKNSIAVHNTGNQLFLETDFPAQYTLFDINGRKIENKTLAAGRNSFRISAGTGIYIVNLTHGKLSHSFKIKID
jgi:alpha-glucosidase